MKYHCYDCNDDFYKIDIAHRGHEVDVELEDEDWVNCDLCGVSLDDKEGFFAFEHEDCNCGNHNFCAECGIKQGWKIEWIALIAVKR